MNAVQEKCARLLKFSVRNRGGEITVNPDLGSVETKEEERGINSILLREQRPGASLLCSGIVFTRKLPSDEWGYWRAKG